MKYSNNIDPKFKTINSIEQEQQIAKKYDPILSSLLKEYRWIWSNLEDCITELYRIQYKKNKTQIEIDLYGRARNNVKFFKEQLQRIDFKLKPFQISFKEKRKIVPFDNKENYYPIFHKKN